MLVESPVLLLTYGIDGGEGQSHKQGEMEWLGRKESNLRIQIQSLLSYR